jgi:hypothetical protein
MSMRNDEFRIMIAGFFAGGCAIQKIPEASPTTATDVVQYLKSQNVNVQFVSGNGKGKIACDGDIIDMQGLVQIANRLRRRQRRPLFEITREQMKRASAKR